MYALASRERTGKASVPPASTKSKDQFFSGTPQVQAKLTVNTPGDHHEQEADAMADKVMRTPSDSWLQRKCAHCEEEEKAQRKPLSGSVTPFIQAKGGNGAAVSESVSSGIASSKGQGSRMDDSTLSFMSSRFGTDFSHVNIHTGGQAAQMSNDLNARAFTTGNNIYFNEGQYNPGSESGKHLLAHELTHVLQQGGAQTSVQRDDKKDPLAEEALKKETEILASPAYKKLKGDSRWRVKQILSIAKKKPLGNDKGQRNYYLQMLETALTSPFDGKETGKTEYDCSPGAEKENKEAVDNAIKFEDEHWKGLFWDVEENLVAERKDKMVLREGEGGKYFRVDRTDPRDIRVLIKIRLIGSDGEVKKIKALEDAIEREVWKSTKGYTLDIEFVDKRGYDVFDITVKFCQWANSGNWADSPEVLSHEVHHALGLDDRYDYIEAHSKNPNMNVAMRLVWFLEQMNKATSDRDSFSKMDTNANPLLAEDVCAVAFKDEGRRKKCIEARKDLDPSNVPAFK